MRRTSYTMDGFCLLYLLLILLMRCGDVETNPGPKIVKSTVSDMEFLQLAKDIQPSYYNAVGTSLGFSYAQLENILIQKSNSHTNAFFDVFMKWNVLQQPPHTNKRKLLAGKLREIDLDGLSDRLLNKPLFPISTGGPRLSGALTIPPSALPQTKPFSPELVKQGTKDLKYRTYLESDVHNPRRTCPPSDYPQHHMYNISDTSTVFFRTDREGSSSQSLPNKRKSPYTHSIPHDDPEITEKQSRTDLESDVHNPRRTLQPSDYPQQRVRYASTYVRQFPQSIPQDDPEIPEKQSSTVSDMEFLQLAKDIQPSYYNAVGTSLGFSYAQLENILIQKSNSHTNAFFDVFMKWNVLQQPPHTNKRKLLAGKLREIDLDGLSDRLLNKPLFPISTGVVERLAQSSLAVLYIEHDEEGEKSGPFIGEPTSDPVSTSKRGNSINEVQELHIDDWFLNGLQKFDTTIEVLFPRLNKLTFTTLQTVSPGVVERLAHSSLAVLSIEHGKKGRYLVPLIGEPTSLGQLFSSSFPQLTCLALRELVMGNIRSEAILHNLRNHLYLKSISIISCFTDDELDPLAAQIATENRMKISLQHDTAQMMLYFDWSIGPLTTDMIDALCHRTCVRQLTGFEEGVDLEIADEECFPDLHGREVDSKLQKQTDDLQIFHTTLDDMMKFVRSLSPVGRDYEEYGSTCKHISIVLDSKQPAYISRASRLAKTLQWFTKELRTSATKGGDACEHAYIFGLPLGPAFINGIP
eukprot:XP_011682387.1 PREDICTED: uncharacterized protein LOC105446818 [Strongylocentrotus purpuratus]